MTYHYCLNQNICFCNTGLARLYQFVCYTILVGGHFLPKSNDDYLPWLLSPSLFYEIYVYTMRNRECPEGSYLTYEEHGLVVEPGHGCGLAVQPPRVQAAYNSAQD